MSFSISVNGRQQELAKGATVGALLAQWQLDPAVVVVEINKQILAKETLETHPLCAGDCVEIIHFVRGG